MFARWVRTPVAERLPGFLPSMGFGARLRHVKTTGLALALIASCGGAPGGDVVAVFSNPELTIPVASSASFSYTLPAPTNVVADLVFPSDVRVVCPGGPNTEIVTCAVTPTWVQGNDAGVDGGEWVVSTDDTPGAFAYLEPPQTTTDVASGAIVVTVRKAE